MTRAIARTRAFVTGLTLALALTACGGDSSTTASSTGSATSAASPTMTAPGGSTEVVTDVQARAVPEDQVDQILADCAASAGVPGTSERCEGVIAQLRACLPHELCLMVGRIAATGAGVLQVREERPGRATCVVDERLCAGVEISAGVVDRLVVLPTPSAGTGLSPSPTTSTDSPSPSPDETTSTTSTDDGSTTDGSTTGSTTDGSTTGSTSDGSTTDGGAAATGDPSSST